MEKSPSRAGEGAERAGLVARAKAYPFARPAHSYLYCNGSALELVRLRGDRLEGGRLERAEIRQRGVRLAFADYLRHEGIARPAPMAERVPVIAHGSNGAPAHLERKFRDTGRDEVIPVLRARLKDFDIVFAPHFAPYGSIPATLTPSPGTAVTVSITYLDRAQLALMHATEIAGVNYAYGRLTDARLEPDGPGMEADGPGPDDHVFCYLTRHGNLLLDGAPVAFTPISAKARALVQRTQEEMLGHARDVIAPGAQLDRFILEVIEDRALRAKRTARLRERADPLEGSFFEIIEG